MYKQQIHTYIYIYMYINKYKYELSHLAVQQKFNTL